MRGAARTAFLSFEWNQGEPKYLILAPTLNPTLTPNPTQGVTQVCDADIWSQCAGEGGGRTLPLQPRPPGAGGAAGTGGGAGPPATVSADTNNDGTFSGHEVRGGP